MGGWVKDDEDVMVEARVNEEEISSDYDLQYDESTGKVNREVTTFSAHQNGNMVSICDLDKTDHENKGEMQIMLRGYVVNGTKKLRVEVGPLVEWCIEYGSVPALWAHTATAWYKMLNPAKEYQKTHELARRRFELCSRAFILAVTIMPEECTYRNIVDVLAQPYQNMKGYTEREILMERTFILEQAESLEDPSLRNCEFVKGLRERGKDLAPTGKEKKKKEGSGGGHGHSGGGGEGASGKDKDRDRERESHKKEKKHHRKYGKGYVWKWRTDSPEVHAALLKRCGKLISALMKDKSAWPFLQPVDPIAHGCPHYLDWIAEPMDLGSIKTKLATGKYKSVDEVVRDARLVWSNCRSYNETDSDLSLMATKLEGKFEEMVAKEEDDLMKSIGKDSGTSELPGVGVKLSPSPVAKKRPRQEVKSAEGQHITDSGDEADARSPDVTDLLRGDFGLSAAERVKRGRTAIKKTDSVPSQDLTRQIGAMKKILEPPQTKDVVGKVEGTANKKDTAFASARKSDSLATKKEPKTALPVVKKEGAKEAPPQKKRLCIAKKCKLPAREGSKYCSESCAKAVAAARVRIMSQVMTEMDIEELFAGRLKQIHTRVIQTGVKSLSTVL